MAHNSGDEIVFDSLADIDASKETWNIRVQVIMHWKQTYKNNPNMVSSFDFNGPADFIGQVVSTDPMRVIMDKESEKKLMNMVAQDLIIADMDLNVKSSINTSQLNTDTVVAKEEYYYLRFPIKNIDDIPYYNENDDDNNVEPFTYDGCGGVSDVYEKVRVVIRVEDETGSSSFVSLDRHVKDVINRDNQWLMEKISKMSDDEGVVGAVFKGSHAYEQDSINSDGTPINKCFKDKSVSIDVDNIDVVDLDAVTPTTTSIKQPIEIVTTTESFEWSSSKDGVVAPILKIPKMEKME
ncbi:unnamed protein product [Lactuca virosa]|uniref:DUF223 domain-containing protein n=1 Tax=Lactuca virosa TaxID=75947 RepID=A0AAU9P1G0_9ASTR|nr:unnamed protein product [Lactuca virosa]